MALPPPKIKKPGAQMPSFIAPIKPKTEEVEEINEGEEMVEELEGTEEEFEGTEGTEEGTEGTEEEAPKKRKSRKKATGEKTTPNRMMEREDMEFVPANIQNMTYAELAEARGITKPQINRLLNAVKKDLRDRAKTDAEKAHVEKIIAERYSRPDGSFGGRGSKEAPVKKNINSIVDDIFSEISG